MYYFVTYALLAVGVIASLIASVKLKSTFRKYSKVGNSRQMTGREAAERILRSAGIYDVQVEHISGDLTDHYSPNEKILRLSDSVYGSTSVAAVGVAAHECGHAIQHQEGYAPLKLRSLSVPLANVGSKLSWPIIVLGLAFSWYRVVDIGILLFAVVVFFQLITLPVEVNASSRALRVLEGNGILVDQELGGARKVLTAAAFTYVASLLNAIIQLARLLLIRNNRRR